MKILEPGVVAEVTRAVEAMQPADLKAAPEWGAFGFLQGVVGLGFFAAARQRFLAGSSEMFEATLERAVELFNTAGAGPGLHTGIAGLGLLVAQNVEAPELLEGIDEALRANLQRKQPLFSLRGGLAGFALYAAVRVRQGAAKELAAEVVQRLSALAERGPHGLTWVVPTDYAKARGVEVPAEPIYESGMAHGQAGLLVGLASLAQAGVAGASELIGPALEWTWAVARPPPNRYAWVLFGPGGATAATQLNVNAWCTGDPGVARAAWLAARAIGHEPHAQRALELAGLLADEVVAGRRAGVEGRVDLCCGSSAVGHIFHRFFEETGQPRFRAAATLVLTEAWSQVAALEGLGFQFGRTGNMAAVMSACTDTPLPWDAVVAMDLPRSS